MAIIHLNSFSCELLSFFSIFGIQNNFVFFFTLQSAVVNCFHFSVSLGYKTTDATSTRSVAVLWIAFIFQYLWDTKQQKNDSLNITRSCELLSFFSIFGIQNNAIDYDGEVVSVVNCFHFSVSLGYKTTTAETARVSAELWIAFIFQYLWDTKQLHYPWIIYTDSCELLSFFSIFGIQNNSATEWTTRLSVVNCFHFSVSLGYKTTKASFESWQFWLWIAFIFQYLWDTKQRLYLSQIMK